MAFYCNFRPKSALKYNLKKYLPYSLLTVAYHFCNQVSSKLKLEISVEIYSEKNLYSWALNLQTILD